MPQAPSTTTSPARRRGKFQRARIRHFLFTLGPDRISGGRFRRRHMAKDVVTREIEIASPRWPRAFDGMRIGHVSDFHLGDLLPLDRALAVLDQLARLEPDLVACTGDVVDLRHDEAAPLLRAMGALGAPLGTALVLGNHDELHCPETIARFGIDAGVNVLRNQAMEVVRNGSRLTIAGIDWAKSPATLGRYIDQTCGAECDLLLAHNPKAFARAAQHAIPLTLAGHTHGGQIAMKNRPNACLAPAHRHRAGLFERGPSRLFVTTGVGAWFPLRINCPAEIALITMRHADEPAVAQTGDGKRRRSRKRRATARVG